jgi:hypothetical protein
VVVSEPTHEFLAGVMRIDSTEYFFAASGFWLQRGRNEVDETAFDALPEETKRKLRILESHGVVRLYANTATAATG